MKLLLCVSCSDVFSLSTKGIKTCSCGKTSGEYVNHLDAVVTGQKNKFVVLGFANDSLVDAIRDQFKYGDGSVKMDYGHEIVTKGREFFAFIIPDCASTVKRIYTDAAS